MNEPMKQNAYYEPLNQSCPPAPGEKRLYTAGQRWLLLFALAIGLTFAFVFLGKGTFETNDFSHILLRYGLFWAVYAVAFYFAAWKQAMGKWTGWAILAVGFWLVLRGLVYQESTLNTLNLLAIPLLLMLHAVECAFTAPPMRQGAYLAMYLKGWFVAPFVCISRFFGATGSVFAKKEQNPRAKAIRLGLLCGLPLLIIVFSLLLSADAAMEYYFMNLFRLDNAGPTVLRLLCALTVAVLFYSFLTYMVYEKKRVPQEPYRQAFPPMAVNTVVIMLLGAYALFAAFQFAYLTGLAGLPMELTYSEYAVKGFGELCTVAAINLTVFALCLTFTGDNRLTRGLLLGLMGATALLLASAFYRLCLYIDAYGLTVRRILPLWFMLYLFGVMGLCALRLYQKKLSLLRLCAGLLVIFYLGLSVVNLDAAVAKSVLAKADARGSLSQSDADFLRYTLSNDARDVMLKSKWREQIWYDVAAEDIPAVASGKLSTGKLTLRNETDEEVASVSVSRKRSEEFGQNADGSPLLRGDSIDFEMPRTDDVPFTVTVYDVNGNALCTGSFAGDFERSAMLIHLMAENGALRLTE